jgi:predicted metalloprotease with PDZ domain
VLAARSGIWTADQYRSYLAYSAAEMDHRPGRTWRNLQDTATAAQTLYDTSEQWDNWRRSVDYYQEGELIWLDVDTTIRKLSNGKRSLNDFCARFLGFGGNTPPEVIPYTFEDIVSNLNSIQPNDWAAFLNERLTTKSPRAPLGGITNGGYHLEYNSEPNDFFRARENHDRGVDAWYSLGISVTDNSIDDVLMGSPAYKAGLGPAMKIVAINGRQANEDLLHDAIRDTKTSSQPVELIVENAGYFKVLKIDYHSGELYPHLVRDDQTPDRLAAILKPMTNHAETKSAE